MSIATDSDILKALSLENYIAIQLLQFWSRPPLQAMMAGHESGGWGVGVGFVCEDGYSPMN